MSDRLITILIVLGLLGTILFILSSCASYQPPGAGLSDAVCIQQGTCK